MKKLKNKSLNIGTGVKKIHSGFLIFMLLLQSIPFPSQAAFLSLDKKDIFPLAEDGYNINQSVGGEEKNSAKEKKDNDKEEAAADKAKNISMPFVENQGQIDDEKVRYYANIFSGTFYVTENSLMYLIGKKEKMKKERENQEGPLRLAKERFEKNKSFIFRESFVGYNGEISDIHSVGTEVSQTHVSYFKKNNKEDWKSGLIGYNSLSLGYVWNDIRVDLRSDHNNVEKVFIVEKNGKPEDIKIKAGGVDNLSIGDDGSLIYEIGEEKVSMTAPVAYQLDADNNKIEVAVSYKIVAENIYSFEVEDYDKNLDLIIDPLLASTFLEGTVNDMNYPAIAVAADGSVFVAGETNDANYPVTAGVYDGTYNGSSYYYGDLVIAKFSSDLTQLLALTYFGGTADELSWNTIIDFDQAGNVFVSLETRSSNYPTTAGAYDITYNGGSPYYGGDNAIAKFDSNLTQLLASTYLGGTGQEDGGGIVVDDAGLVYMVSSPCSNDFPTTAGVVYGTDPHLGSCSEAAVSKFDNNLTSLLVSTYVPGVEGTAIKLDSAGNIFIAGITVINYLATTSQSYDQTFNGVYDVALVKLNNNMTAQLGATYLGGNYYEDPAKWSQSALAIDSADNVIIAGETQSTDFPTTEGAHDRSYSDYKDSFVSKLDNNLSNLLASTYLGGEGTEEGCSIVLDSEDNVYFSAYTDSSNFFGDIFPTTKGAYQKDEPGDSFNGYTFVTKLNSGLTDVLASTYLGGSNSGSEFFQFVALDAGGNVYVAGYTDDNTFPVTDGAYDETLNDAAGGFFISKFDSDLSGYPIDHLKVRATEDIFADGFEDGMDSSTWTTTYSTSNFGAYYVYASSVLADGKILIGGNFSQYNLIPIVNVARLNADGSLDTTFVPPVLNGSVYDLSVQSDGKIVIVGGFTTCDGISRNRVARLNADGSLDTTFDPGTGAGNTIYSLGIRNDGKIIIGGTFASFNGTTINRLARLNANGTLDGTFTVGTGANSDVQTLVIQPDQKIVIGGIFTTYSGTARRYIARVNADGTLDTTFTVGTGFNAGVESLALQSDGKVVVGGRFSTYGGVSAGKVARLNTDGTLDGTFSIGTGANNNVYALAIQPDQKVIISGSFTTFNGVTAQSYARLNSDGSLDAAFGPVPIGYAERITFQSDGKILIGGFSSLTRSGYRIGGIVRLNTNGTDDTNFNVITDLPFGWSVDESQSHSGTKALYSSGHQAAKNIWLNTSYDFPADGRISFYWKSEINDPNNYSPASFCVDSTPGSCDTWTGGLYDARIIGHTDWTLVTFPVSAGTHYFEWNYEGSAINGGIWLDDVRFSYVLDQADVFTGVPREIEIEAINNQGDKYMPLTGERTVTLSGPSSSEGVPTCTDKDGNNVPFGTPTTLSFSDGIASCNMNLYATEAVSIDATDGTFSSMGSPDYNLDIAVNGATPAVLSPENSIISVSPSPTVINTPISITLTSKDIDNNNYLAGGATVVFSVTGANNITPEVTDNSNGTYTATYTPVNPGVDQITATMNSVAVASDTDGVSDGVFNLTIGNNDIPDPVDPSVDPPVDPPVDDIPAEDKPNKKDYIDLKDSKNDTLVFDVDISKDKEVRSDSIKDKDDESTEVSSIKIKTKEDKKIEGDIEIKSKKEKPDDVIFPPQVDVCVPYQIIDVDTDFPDKNIKKTSINFRIKKEWLEKNGLEKIIFVMGKSSNVLNNLTKKDKWLILPYDLVKENDGEYIYRATSDSLDGWWGVYGCDEEELGENQEEEVLISEEDKKDNDETGGFAEPVVSPSKEEDAPAIGQVEAPEELDAVEEVATEGSFGSEAARGIAFALSILGLLAALTKTFFVSPLSFISLVPKTLQAPFLLRLINLGRRGVGSVLQSMPFLTISRKDRFSLPFDKKRNETFWGVVFDSYTKQPVVDAVVYLMSEDRKKSMDQKFTDKDGRFGFLISEDGNYSVKVKKGAYVISTENEIDDLYGNIYTQPVALKSGDVFSLNIALKAPDFDWNKFAQDTWKRYNSFLFKFIEILWTILYIAGFILAIYNVFNYPNTINYLVISFYGVLLIFKLFKDNKKFGIISSRETKTPLPFAVVELYDLASDQRNNFAISDVLGRYYLLAENGRYNLKLKCINIKGESFKLAAEVSVRKGIFKNDLMV